MIIADVDFVTGSAEDVDADCGDVGAEELLHHHRHVPADPLLRSAGGYSFWHGQAWLQSGEVRRDHIEHQDAGYLYSCIIKYEREIMLSGFNG